MSNRLWLLVVLLAVGFAARAGTHLPAAPGYALASPDSLRRETLDSLVQAQCPGYPLLRVASVLFVGNSVTKERILRAELDFREGDTLTAARLAKQLEANRRRLFNLQLFHQVLVQVACRNGELAVLFSVQERWYTFPVPIFSLADRNFRAWANRSDRWSRVDYGLHLTRNNFRGRNEVVRGNLQLGFNRKYELFYEAPGYGRRRRIGFGAGASYYRARALDYATVADQLATFRPVAGSPIERQYYTAGLRWRRTVQLLAALDVSYHHEQISDSINLLNPDYYLGRTRREYFDFGLSGTLNQRNTFAYPLTGRYAQAALVYRHFLADAAPPQLLARARYARYLALGGPLYYSAAIQGQLRFSRRLSYADNRALGYEALVRGYDAYVIDGRHYALLQQGLSYRIFDAGRVKLKGVSNPKINTIPLVLYLNTFADAGYVGAPTAAGGNYLPRRLLASAGVALHLVTYYDRVFTAEYTRNLRGQGGFFLRSEFPI
ncbi:POTRA domain-containing protein [Hymenobacter psychrotolerans]|uniref:Surface antigen variable number repeat-containing protein n=1 Tax=Hymenobacter psychrotolerans DSM 18569 TaxID=1121959 RepID=A0A1M6P1V3_9BACT|nr:POTRA domain-containing protein [Hymenobacter psychrotolerans]SHK01987.1 Surface antigen variable number repeat-containing protein [Hymenobacter psychrotolerans DSM 18569]